MKSKPPKHISSSQYRSSRKEGISYIFKFSKGVSNSIIKLGSKINQMKNDIKRRIEEDTELEVFKFDNRKPKRFGSYKESLGVSEFDSGKLNRFKGFEFK